jgi:radical SAM protein with 4Fe4S-binding SPASM domain
MIVPKQIIIEPTDRCQLRCKYCPILTAKTSRDMSIDMFKSIIDRINFKTTVIPWMNGEPLLHPQYTEMVKYVSSKGIPQYITTNGMKWVDEFFEHITDSYTTCYQLIFSLDGMWDTKSIEKARPASNRERIRANIERFIELKKSKGSKIDLAVKICERGQDYEERERYVNHWLDKVNFVCVGKALTQKNDESMRSAPCQYPDNNFMVIRANGDVVWCAYNEDMANNPDNKIGNIGMDKPLLDFYNNDKYTEFRENQSKGIYSDICSKCGFAYTGQGLEGVIYFRTHPNRKVYFHRDYYNEFYSLNQKWKNIEYYKRGYKSE